MGLFGLFSGQQKTSGRTDGLSALRQKVEDNPKDARLAQDLAMQLKAKGQLAEAFEYVRRAAQAHKEGGFLQKSVAVLKSATAWGPPPPELLEDLAGFHLELKHKEDARETLVKLRSVLREAGRHAEAEDVGRRISELGPGR
ncbi:MAG: hypothetical protein AB1938_23505 [Myxococcota bacterium]